MDRPSYNAKFVVYGPTRIHHFLSFHIFLPFVTLIISYFGWCLFWFTLFFRILVKLMGSFFPVLGSFVEEFMNRPSYLIVLVIWRLMNHLLCLSFTWGGPTPVCNIVWYFITFWINNLWVWLSLVIVNGSCIWCNIYLVHSKLVLAEDKTLMIHYTAANDNKLNPPYTK